MPSDYSTLRLVNPVHTGFMATTAPVQSFIGRKITPRISVDCPDYIGQIFVDTHVSFMGTPQSLVMSPGVPLAKMTTANPGSKTYTCVPYGVASNGIPKLGAARSQLPVPLVQREFTALRPALEIAEEIRYRDLYQTTGNWTTTAACTALTTGVKWSAAGAAPIADLRDYINTVRKAAHNNMPNTLIVPYDVAVAIGKTPEVRGYAYFTGAGAVAANRSIGVGAVKALLESELEIAVHIASGRYNTASLSQTHTEAELWADTCWLGILNANAAVQGTSIRTVQTAALAVDEISSLSEVGLGSVGVYGAGVDDIAPSQGNVWIPYVQHSSDELVISADLGATITDCI